MREPLYVHIYRKPSTVKESLYATTFGCDSFDMSFASCIAKFCSFCETLPTSSFLSTYWRERERVCVCV